MPTTDRKLRVFLCHASQDKPIVRELYQRLLHEGWIDPWLDERSLLPGEDWRMSIEMAVESSDLVVICLSNNSVSKEGFVQKELRYAREISLEKPEGIIFLIPLRLDECDVPRGLRFFQWTDYFGEKKEEAYKALLQSLKSRNDQIFQRAMIEYRRKEAEARVHIEAENKEKYENKYAASKRAEVQKNTKQVSSFSSMNEVKVRKFKTYGLIEINGRADRSNAAQLSHAFESLTYAGQFKILVDMTNLVYMSSGSFRALLAAQRNCKRYNRGAVILAGVPDQIREALELAGFSDLFRIYEDVREAVGSF